MFQHVHVKTTLKTGDSSKSPPWHQWNPLSSTCFCRQHKNQPWSPQNYHEPRWKMISKGPKSPNHRLKEMKQRLPTKGAHLELEVTGKPLVDRNAWCWLIFVKLCVMRNTASKLKQAIGGFDLYIWYKYTNMMSSLQYTSTYSFVVKDIWKKIHRHFLTQLSLWAFYMNDLRSS